MNQSNLLICDNSSGLNNKKVQPLFFFSISQYIFRCSATLIQVVREIHHPDNRDEDFDDDEANPEDALDCPSLHRHFT